MSINSITSNPVILNDLSQALNLLHPTTGITQLVNTDNNCALSVVGNTGTVNLKPSITITDIGINGTVSLLSNTGTLGQVLTSQGASAPIWTVIPSSNPLNIQFFINQQSSIQLDVTQIVFPFQTFNNLIIGNTYYILMCGTYNNRGSTPPTVGTTFVSYSALLNTTQLSTSETQIDNTMGQKIPFSYVVEFVATNTTNSIAGVIYISGTTQINTISSDTLDYCNMLLMGV